MGHDNPSGDLIIAGDIVRFLKDKNHRVMPASSLRGRWIYWKPWLWPQALAEKRRLERFAARTKPDLWFTYHTYYKAPDLLGPFVSKNGQMPYVIFEASYATKKKKELKSLPGFILNRRALLAAGHVFTNRKDDYINVGRIVPRDKLTYVPPGIITADFQFDSEKRKTIRQEWSAENMPVVLACAMFRPGVKARGLAWVIKACGKLMRGGLEFKLVLIGDGREKETLKKLARTELGDNVLFTGRIDRDKLGHYYSAADIFAFPGFDESLGMVYLEAQSCGLPVVAMADGGIPEVVMDKVTGLLSPVGDFAAFTKSLETLIRDRILRKAMGKIARRYVREKHDLNENYSRMEAVLINLKNADTVK